MNSRFDRTTWTTLIFVTDSNNSDFLGASLVLDETKLYTCAPLAKSEIYKAIEENAGFCYEYEWIATPQTVSLCSMNQTLNVQV